MTMHAHEIAYLESLRRGPAEAVPNVGRIALDLADENARLRARLHETGGCMNCSTSECGACRPQPRAGCALLHCRQCGTGVYAERDAGPTPFGGRSSAGRRADLS